MNESILNTIKKLLGIEESYEVYDVDVITFINSSLLALKQAGVGNQEFQLNDKSQTWSELLGDESNFVAAKTYIFIQVKLTFDPPATSYARESLRKVANENLWRLNVEYEEGEKA